MRNRGFTRRRRLLIYADPVLHAALAGGVVAPLARSAGPGHLAIAVAAGTLIDIDHPLAARSIGVERMCSMDCRPRAHSAPVALGLGAAASAVGGTSYGWAAFAGLASHLLRDAGDRQTKTPILWPLSPRRSISRAAYAGGIAALAAGSLAAERAYRRSREVTAPRAPAAAPERRAAARRR
jgi:hypothetical protein